MGAEQLCNNQQGERMSAPENLLAIAQKISACLTKAGVQEPAVRVQAVTVALSCETAAKDLFHLGYAPEPGPSTRVL